MPAGGRAACGQGFGEPLSLGKGGLAPGGLRSFLLAGFVTSFHLWDAGPLLVLICPLHLSVQNHE